MILRRAEAPHRPVELAAMERMGWLRPGSSWEAWRTAIRALLADPLIEGNDLDAEALRLYVECTGRTIWPPRRSSLGYYVVSRRGGKSLAMSKLVVALAAFRDVVPHLAEGEIATIALVAADRRQARVLFRYVVGLLKSDPALWALVQGEPTVDAITLANRVVIEIHTGSFRALRGYTLLAIVLDEGAFLDRQMHANPASEILGAALPGLATLEDVGSLALVISSPHAPEGILHDARITWWGANDAETLYWQAASAVMNPTLKLSTIERAVAADPAKAAAEWLGQFRGDLQSYTTREALMAWVPRGVSLRAPVPGITYVLGEDPAGGQATANADSYTWAVAHCELDATGRPIAVLDLVGEAEPPFVPNSAVARIAVDAQQYNGIPRAKGDAYAKGWPAERHLDYGLVYETVQVTRSEAYLALLPELADGRIRLLDHGKLLSQFLTLERRTARGGRESVDHRSGSHDDLCNAAAIALLTALDDATAQGLGTAAPDAYDQGVADGWARFMESPVSGEVVDTESVTPYENEDTRWSRVDPTGTRRPLW